MIASVKVELHSPTVSASMHPLNWGAHPVNELTNVSVREYCHDLL